MPEIWEKAKAHPYITAGIIFGVGIVVILIYKSLHSTPVNTGSSDYAAYQAAAAQEAASGNQLAGLQAQLQAAGNQVNAEQAISTSHDAASITLAQIAADTAKNQAELEAQVAQSQAAASVQVAGIGADASVAQSSIAAGVNNNNNAAALYSQILSTISSHLTPSTVGQVLSSNFNFNGVNISGVSSAENIPTFNNMPVFITDPSGAVYHYQYGAPGPNNIYLSTDPQNYNYGYQYMLTGTHTVH